VAISAQEKQVEAAEGQRNLQKTSVEEAKAGEIASELEVWIQSRLEEERHKRLEEKAAAEAAKQAENLNDADTGTSGEQPATADGMQCSLSLLSYFHSFTFFLFFLSFFLSFFGICLRL
jgi:hypothetical protein